jgi:ABC-2 type transport system ATP-binding protein
MSAISSVSLSKTYRNGVTRRPQVRALVDFSIDVRQGEIFSLLGPNGAGKTTFIKILLSLTHPTSGHAVMLGHALPDVRVMRQIGYLPENHRYPGYLTGRQVLHYFGRLGEVDRNVLRSRIPELLKLVGLADWAN